MKKELNPKILIFDIESTNLAANFGFILCISYKWLHEKQVHTIAITDFPSFQKDHTSDKNVLKEFYKIYIGADMVVAHYGSRFDIKFINTRCLYHNLPPFPPVAFIDTWYIAKRFCAFNSNRLKSITEFFNLPEKTPIRGDKWIRATSGDQKAIKYVIKHCVADVLALEATYLKLRVLYDTHPNVNVIEGEGRAVCCPRCGSPRTVQQGRRITRVSIFQRYKCKDCGAWSQGPPVRTGVHTR